MGRFCFRPLEKNQRAGDFSDGLLGGVVAGILIDIFQAVSKTFDLDEQWAEVMTALGKSSSMSQAIAFAVWGLVVGILVVWLYAAMRPRLGAGPKTALCAGLLIWVTVYALGSATAVFLHYTGQTTEDP